MVGPASEQKSLCFDRLPKSAKCVFYWFPRWVPKKKKKKEMVRSLLNTSYNVITKQFIFVIWIKAFPVFLVIRWSHTTTQKKRIEEQLNCFWNMCPKPFTWAEIKENFFPTGSATIWTLFFPNLFTLYRYLFTSLVMWSKNIPKTASTMHLNYKLCWQMSHQ